MGTKSYWLFFRTLPLPAKSGREVCLVSAKDRMSVGQVSRRALLQVSGLSTMQLHLSRCSSMEGQTRGCLLQLGEGSWRRTGCVTPLQS